ncbi:GAG-pre-integrase domain-containing protein [Hirsutella rhossiliensis]
MNTSFNGKEAVLLIKDEFTSMIFIYLLNDATQGSVMTALRNHEAMVQRQWNLNICIIHRDNDRSLQSAAIWGDLESSSVFAQQIAHAEPQLRTPFQLLHQWLRDNNRDIGYQQDQPDITFLKAYGCRAYPLTPQALQNRQKKDLKTDPHTEIGYLVGYDSTNIFRIWIPSTSEVRRNLSHSAWKYSFQPTSRTSRITRKSPLKSMNLNLTPLSNLLNLRPGDATTIVVQPEPSDHEDSDDQDEFHDIQHPYPTPDPGPSDSATALSPLTKALPGQKFATFVKQLGLVDISTLLGI